MNVRELNASKGNSGRSGQGYAIDVQRVRAIRAQEPHVHIQRKATEHVEI